MNILISYLNNRNNFKKVDCKNNCGLPESMSDPLYEAVKNRLNLSGREWEEMTEVMNSHPMVKLMTIREEVTNSKIAV